MGRFTLRRLLFSLPLLLGITFLTFLFIQIAPGDFLDNLRLNPQISRDTLRLYQEKFHLDKPFFIQYLVWLKNILHGDFGYSFSYKAPVLAVVSSRLFNTFILSLSSLIFTWLFVIPLGVVAALNKNKLIDRLLSFFSYLGISVPTFFLAFILLFLATFTGWIPLGGMRSIRFEEFSLLGKFFDIIKHLIIPTIVLSLGSICILQRIMRANLLEVLGSPYILGAKARGLSRLRIIYIHALKNALNPMITIFGYQFSALLSGAALVEIIIGWPGLGVVTLEAVRSQDIYLVMGSVLSGGFLLILGNLLADILLAFFDPRIRFEKDR
ncbi:MAG: ABC transporter permease [Candidatus Omnitrophica bacterium]|jgi:peptide/nickel transport system permease protein|nr:ABC transporter permease [Candidatus Omnitrophota bacterium]